jgi:hypothetical protein
MEYKKPDVLKRPDKQDSSVTAKELNASLNVALNPHVASSYRKYPFAATSTAFNKYGTEDYSYRSYNRYENYQPATSFPKYRYGSYINEYEPLISEIQNPSWRIAPHNEESGFRQLPTMGMPLLAPVNIIQSIPNPPLPSPNLTSNRGIIIPPLLNSEPIYSKDSKDSKDSNDPKVTSQDTKQEESSTTSSPKQESSEQKDEKDSKYTLLQRKLRNREAAKRSRDRKKVEINALHKQLLQLKNENIKLKHDNYVLCKQLEEMHMHMNNSI